MKKPNLISALAIAAVAAAGMSLPATASASPFKYEETQVVHGDYPRESHMHPVHNVDNRYHESRNHSHARWAPPRYRHDHGHHFGHRRMHEHRYDYRPVERYESRHDGDVRVRISYDLHL